MWVDRCKQGAQPRLRPGGRHCKNGHRSGIQSFQGSELIQDSSFAEARVSGPRVSWKRPVIRRVLEAASSVASWASGFCYSGGSWDAGLNRPRAVGGTGLTCRGGAPGAPPLRGNARGPRRGRSWERRGVRDAAGSSGAERVPEPAAVRWAPGVPGGSPRGRKDGLGESWAWRTPGPLA